MSGMRKLLGNLPLDPRQRRALLLVWMALSLPAVTRAAELPSPPAAQAEREVRALEAARKDAIQAGDRAALESLYAADFRGVTSGGAQVGREEVIAALLRAKGKAAEPEDLQVRIFGNVAVVTGRLRLADNGGTLRYLHVYVRRDGPWQLVAGQSTNVPE
jgi:ketosteroid isomerase-like protein